MKIKYNPCQWNEYANIEVLPDTKIIPIDENSIRIDGELYEFDELSVDFPDVRTQTEEKIIEAHREDAELYLTVMRFYTRTCQPWDTGGYHEIVW